MCWISKLLVVQIQSCCCCRPRSVFVSLLWRWWPADWKVFPRFWYSIVGWAVSWCFLLGGLHFCSGKLLQS